MKNSVSVTKTDFGTTTHGQEISKYILKNEQGTEVDIINFGGIVTSVKVPDKNGKIGNIVLGYDNLEQYIISKSYFGAIIGRYGNRIANARFKLNGTTYQLETNDGKNHLHGGLKGFDKVVWTASEATTDSIASLDLTYISKDGEESYPGTLTTKVIYTLNNDNELEVSYKTTTDKETIVNLTQHSYFNLSGDFSKDILDEVLTINADKFLPVDGSLIPTGDFKPVENTPFDFRKPKKIGKDIGQENEQLIRGNGYDHCWVLNEQGTFRKVASLFDTDSGRYMEVFTDQPGIQFYSGNFLDGNFPSRTGLCLETQHYPDSPNHDAFPSVVLKPGDKHETKTRYKFSTK